MNVRFGTDVDTRVTRRSVAVSLRLGGDRRGGPVDCVFGEARFDFQIEEAAVNQLAHRGF